MLTLTCIIQVLNFITYTALYNIGAFLIQCEFMLSVLLKTGYLTIIHTTI